jgi:hypothetical protein
MRTYIFAKYFFFVGNGVFFCDRRMYDMIHWNRTDELKKNRMRILDYSERDSEPTKTNEIYCNRRYESKIGNEKWAVRKTV